MSQGGGVTMEAAFECAARHALVKIAHLGAPPSPTGPAPSSSPATLTPLHCSPGTRGGPFSPPLGPAGPLGAPATSPLLQSAYVLQQQMSPTQREYHDSYSHFGPPAFRPAAPEPQPYYRNRSGPQMQQQPSGMYYQVPLQNPRSPRH